MGDYNVITMMEDNEGNLWIGTEDHGINLFHYETGTFSYLHNDPNDSSSLAAITHGSSSKIPKIRSGSERPVVD